MCLNANLEYQLLPALMTRQFIKSDFLSWRFVRRKSAFDWTWLFCFFLCQDKKI